MTVYVKPDRPLPQLPLGGYPVAAVTTAELKEILVRDLEQGRQRLLFFVNTNFVNHCEHLQAGLGDPDVILVNDGIGMDIASRLIHRKTYPDNLNGTDFVPALLDELVARSKEPEGKPAPRVFLLGGKPGIARRAGDVLEQRGVTVAGARDGYSESRDADEVVAAMNDTGADIVLVAMGNPRQEEWILNNQPALDGRLLVGVGALLDFLAGDKPRAPEIIRRLRLEWFYRLSLEPRRLLRRYTVDIGAFLVHCWRRRS